MEDEEAWLKGPFVQVGLPFSGGKAGRHFFQTFQTAYPGYIHQELAWERLCSNRKAQSTLVARDRKFNRMSPSIARFWSYRSCLAR